jgi:iron complex outermembrane receptor protein
VNYRPSGDLAFFGIYSEGYRPGGNNGSVAPHDCLEDENIGSYVDRYNSDKIKNYEVGVKGFALDRRVQFSSAVYQIDWSGVQADVYMPSCGFSYTANAATARSRGIEFESTSLVTDSLKLLLNVSYTNSKFTEDVPSLGAEAGDSMTMVPKYNFYVALDQEFEMWGREGSLRLDLAGYGEYKSHFNTRDEDVSPAYEVVNLSAGMQLTDSARVSVHVNNLLNADYVLYKRARYRSSWAQGSLDERYGEERSIAVRLDFKF